MRASGSGSRRVLRRLRIALGPHAGQALGLTVLVAVHAADDAVVPVEQSSDYVRIATAAGGDARLVTVPGGHFDLIDPGSAAWGRVVQLLP